MDDLFGGDLDLALGDLLGDVVGRLTINGAANRVGGTEDLLDGARELLGHGAGAHDAGNLNNIIKGDVAVMLDVLILLAVTDGLLEGTDDQGGGRGDNAGDSLTVLDGQLNSDAETLPVLGGLGDVLTNLLGGETKGTNLGGKSGGGTNLTTGGTEVD